MKVIIYTQNEMVSVVIPAPAFLEDHTLDEVASGAVPIGIDYIIVDYESLIPDIDFRNAWKLNGDVIDIDFVKAKEITKDRLRIEREPLLRSLDIEMMKNWNNIEKMNAIDIEKQRLRDITLQVDKLTTIHELRRIHSFSSDTTGD